MRVAHFDRFLVFLSTLSLRRATAVCTLAAHVLCIFLSTLSLRRATGHRPYQSHSGGISIHALLAESDRHSGFQGRWSRYFYPRSPCGERLMGTAPSATELIFLSTLSLRRATVRLRLCGHGPNYFYPRSPCGERPVTARIIDPTFGFLSTLSLRRATVRGPDIPVSGPISIHALLAESDLIDLVDSPVAKISIHALLAESD